ncbi:30 kDa salivary gland allergen Aed a 3-like [Culex pipiens pallens]|uniref:30 kDa salivary gland allergen Aed a 3-like n=1 Tax=Culex pipiens pallens TaxID=42434 RepID=UPI001952C312|nr:30 kDa salivary gland allergen Aed a 3-like [Culex pipiens pallens]
MKLVWPTLLALFLLIGTLANAESTEETLPSTESEPSSATIEDDQPEKPTENPEPSSPASQDDDQPKEPTEDGGESSEPDDDDSEKPSKKGEKVPGAGKGPSQKGSYAATYQEIVKILDSVDFKSIEDLHLQRMLENAFQARVRNPVLEQTGQIADFGAIKSCFGKLTGEVKKLINAAKKQFKTCKTGGGNSSGCTDQQENAFADGVINLATTLQGCISSKRKD